MSDAYGELFTSGDIPIGLDISIAGTFVKWTTFSAVPGGPVDLVRVDGVNNQFIIEENGAGLYLALITGSFGGDPNTEIIGGVFINGLRRIKIEFHRSLGGARDTGSVAGQGQVSLVPGDVLDVRLTTDKPNSDIDILHLVFTLQVITRAL